MEPADPLSEGLGRAIRVIRAGHDMSRKELAERSGLSYSYVAEIEGGTKTPSSKALAALSRALDVAVHELMEAADRWEHTPPPHSYEELRDSTRVTMRTAFSSASDSPSRAARARAARRELAESAEPSGDTAAWGSAENDLRELLRLLAELGPEDRERLLDLARRLAEEE